MSMRLVSLLISFLVTLSLASLALVYLERRVGEQRIYVQESWLSAPEGQAYRSYGEVGDTGSDTLSPLQASMQRP